MFRPAQPSAGIKFNTVQIHKIDAFSRSSSQIKKIVILIMKPTRCTISQIYLINYFTCFGYIHCPPSAVSQQCIHAIDICHASSIGVCQRVYSVEILLMMDSGHVRNMQSTLSNKYGKQCISLAFIIRIKHDARSSECQIHFCNLLNLFFGPHLLIFWLVCVL